MVKGQMDSEGMGSEREDGWGVRRIALAAAALAATLPLAGCRQSSALSRLSYQSLGDALGTDANAGEEGQDDSADQGPTDENSEDTRYHAEAGATTDETAEAQELAQSAADGTALGATGDDSDTSAGTQGDSTGAEATGDGSGGGGGGSSSATPPDPEQNATREVNLPTGQVVTLPTNVTTVAAVGATAEMFYMLRDSTQSLVATSSRLKSGFFPEVFPDVANAAAVWGDTDTPDTLGSTAFDALCAAAPQVVFCSSSTFSSDQVASLSAASITPVYMQELTASDQDFEGRVDPSSTGVDENYFVASYLATDGAQSASLENRVLVVAEVLGTAAETLAATFNAYCEDIFARLKKLYPVTYDAATPKYAGGEGLAVQYIFDIEAAADGIDYGSIVLPADANCFMTDYVSMNGYRNVDMVVYWLVSYGAGIYYDDDDELMSLLNYADHISGYGSNTVGIFKSTGAETSYNEQRPNMPFAACYTNPCGACPWVQGSPESVLEPLWLAAKLHSGSSIFSSYGGDGDGYMQNEVAYFYSTYLHCDLSSSQIAAILAGSYAS